MAKKPSRKGRKLDRVLGPSLDMDERGDPIMKDWGKRLARDMEIASRRTRPYPPGYVIRALKEEGRTVEEWRESLKAVGEMPPELDDEDIDEEE